MLTIGLTGGYATGKSTVANYLRELGAHVINADELSHASIKRGRSGYDMVVAAFGTGILGPDGEVDRKALGRLIFADPERRRCLEAIIHPLVGEAMRAERARAEAAGAKVLICEVPLLFEAGLTGEYDQVWVVSAGGECQRARACARDQMTDEEARLRCGAQMPLSEKERRADIVLSNNGDREDLRRQVKEVWDRLD